MPDERENLQRQLAEAEKDRAALQPLLDETAGWDEVPADAVRAFIQAPAADPLAKCGRLAASFSSDDEGEWRTIHGVHVHIDKSGVIDKGPAHLVGKRHTEIPPPTDPMKRYQDAAAAHKAAREAHHAARTEHREARKAAYNAAKGHAARAMETFESHAKAISDISDNIESDEETLPEATRAYIDLDEAKHNLLFDAATHSERKDRLAEVASAAKALAAAKDATAEHKKQAAEILAHARTAKAELQKYGDARRQMKAIHGADMEAGFAGFAFEEEAPRAAGPLANCGRLAPA